MSANVATNQQSVNSPFVNRLTIAHNALTAAFNKSRYFIERAVIIIDKVHVTYIDETELDAGNTSEDNWRDAIIMVQNLESFMSTRPSAPSFYDDINLAMYVDHNINDCVKAYLEAGKEIISL